MGSLCLLTQVRSVVAVASEQGEAAEAVLTPPLSQEARSSLAQVFLWT